MWLIIAAIAALTTTYMWLNRPPETDRLAQLSMVFWGLTLMVFVDHVIGWFLDGAEGDFFDIGVNEFILSICMIVPILVIWEGALIADRFRLRQAMAAKTDDRLREKKEMI